MHLRYCYQFIRLPKNDPALFCRIIEQQSFFTSDCGQEPAALLPMQDGLKKAWRFQREAFI
jgi:hypothetical protein